MGPGLTREGQAGGGALVPTDLLVCRCQRAHLTPHFLLQRHLHISLHAAPGGTGAGDGHPQGYLQVSEGASCEWALLPAVARPPIRWMPAFLSPGLASAVLSSPCSAFRVCHSL